jgi:hypothetical protein
MVPPRAGSINRTEGVDQESRHMGERYISCVRIGTSDSTGR